MSLDLEAEYDNRARVKDSAAIIARWLQESAEAQNALAPRRDIPYGPKPRNRFDVYRPSGGRASTPLVVYIHGGYWQRGAKDDYAFVARELVRRGVSVAIPSYTLCPEVSVAGIVDEMNLFLGALWREVRQRPVIVGHSAGGHLAAMMMVSDVGRGDVPNDLVKAAYGIAGVYELAPLIGTSLNGALNLDETEARRMSPMLGAKPKRRGTFVAAAGGAESSEFIRQAKDFAAAWSGSPVATESQIVAGADHFTIVEELVRPGSPTLERIIAMADDVAG